MNVYKCRINQTYQQEFDIDLKPAGAVLSKVLMLWKSGKRKAIIERNQHKIPMGVFSRHATNEVGPKIFLLTHVQNKYDV